MFACELGFAQVKLLLVSLAKYDTYVIYHAIPRNISSYCYYVLIFPKFYMYIEYQYVINVHTMVYD